MVSEPHSVLVKPVLASRLLEALRVKEGRKPWSMRRVRKTGIRIPIDCVCWRRCMRGANFAG